MAHPHHHRAAADSHINNSCQYGFSTIYIYIVLMKEAVKIKESLLAIVLVGVLLYFIFRRIEVLYVVFAIGILGLASAGFAGFVHKWFGKLTGIIGYINNAILLSLIYWVVLTPIAFLMRLFGKTGVVLKRPVGSNFINRGHLFTKNDLNNPW